ncbi:hypothetical protein CHGG_11079 [Chaetomium globosum CBS 148.51]|uniref:Uncharacterized protein n=1 Tax=Chaetomium globosum (strain ATCC 6205 / CBS 148.51 / DSM 1962 / NBRC 6347 / NRRL 1970) TaxID=306901 RepID=Q2GLX7_CHAGB|nr:uncharacterized protein CHGG_11079 [Chaetomium globosum CBS 148.51]EAQ82903.1 hypothetical protein CHGG_11079 [Chaetomium globosum CBS 148.51]
MANVPSTGASCPDGGSFYICENNATEFVVCCILDPCADDSGKCPHDGLRPASFSGDNHDEIPEQECSSLSSRQNDPCIAGSCQPGYMAPARLSSNVSDRAAFIEEVMKAEVATSASTSTTATSSIGSASGFHTESTTDTTSAAAGGTVGLHTGAVVGITLASTLTAIAILTFLVFKCRGGFSELQVVAPGQFITGPVNGPISPSAQSFGPRHPFREAWIPEPTVPVFVELDGNRWTPSNGRAQPSGYMARS